MGTELAPKAPVLDRPRPPHEAEADRVRELTAAASSANTRRAYRADWASFSEWCADRRRETLPASEETLALYLSHMVDKGLKAATIQRALSAISKAHRLSGVPSNHRAERITDLMKGIRNTLGTAPAKKAPITSEALGSAFETMPSTLAGVRDRALLMVGFAGGFRRSELVGLNVADVRFMDEGLHVTLRKTKTDQEGKGRTLAIHRGKTAGTCPVRLLRRWLELSHAVDGPLFRSVSRTGQVGKGRLSADQVAIRVKAAATAAGLDPKDFAGHSLRAGLVTAAAKAGKPLEGIMQHTDHQDAKTVIGYMREANLFEKSVTKGLY